MNTPKTETGGCCPPPPCSLFLGDCLEVMERIESGSVDMVLCDLPYGTTACKWDSVIPFAPLWAHYRRVCKRNAAIVLTASQPFTSALVMSNINWFKYCWVWEKSQATGHLNAWKSPMRQHEDVVVFYGEQARYNPQITDKDPKNIRPLSDKTRNGDCYGAYKLDKECRKLPIDKSMPRSVLRFNGAQSKVHPTQKPVALMEYLIRTYTNEGETVLDNTMGSGTTGVACANTGRRFIGIEKDADFFRVATERISSANASHEPRP
jgi:site-specific DNA-methyltransferase (adenine-specific)